VFVLRTSSTPVATWFWQTEGRSAECVILGVRPSEFILLEFQSPSRRIFIGSHSLPTSGRLIGPSQVLVKFAAGWWLLDDWSKEKLRACSIQIQGRKRSDIGGHALMDLI
jgi:hypothetical protein